MLAATEVAELSPVKPIVTQTEDFGRKFGQIGQFLAKGGYGWILEQDEMPKSDVPLMTELDIEPNEIWYKIRCVLLPLPQVKRSDFGDSLIFVTRSRFFVINIAHQHRQKYF